MAKDADLGRLTGIGPKSRQMLARAGITTVDELRALGAVEAYVRARQAGSGVSLNLLWGIESALTGVPWQEVARKDRLRLLLALEDRQRRED